MSWLRLIALSTLAIACTEPSEPALDAGDTRDAPDAADSSHAADDADVASPDGGSSPDGSISDGHDLEPEPRGFDACADTGADAGARITLSALFREMVDLTQLTRLPAVPYVARLQSSHNRLSDSATPDDDAWHADQDFIRPAPGETVTLLDTDGPGVITRIWSASPSGTLRVFIDGAAQPAIEAELSELLSGAGDEPFGAPFGFVAAYGHNLYFPIAYASHCLVTLTGSGEDVVYYHIAYRSYPEGTELESYSDEAVSAATCALGVTANRLAAAQAFEPKAADEAASFDLESGAGETLAAVIAAPEGGGVLRELRLTPAQLSPDLLRATALVVEMDGEVTVRAPLLDFFALGFDAIEMHSLPVAADASGVLTSHWPMPFERQARVWLEHSGDGELTALLSTVTTPAPFTEDSLYFYAGWRAPTLELSKPPHDMVLAKAKGRGYYVGNTLNIVNPSKDWWGEGDERIYVDGEAFPSHFGTGTEDYYGYAWCANELFSTPYIGQTASTSHQSFGHASLYRFHILDAIPFTESLRFDLEVRHWGKAVEVSYDSLSVWYARPGATISGEQATTDLFRLPEIEVDPPAEIGAGPYRCGG